MKLHRKYGVLALGSLAALGVAAVHTWAAKTSTHTKATTKSTRKLHLQGGGGAFPVSVDSAHTATDNQYSVTGNVQGQVIVTSVTTGNVVQTLQMDANVPVRQVFLLDNDQTVGAAQKDHTIFWNISTGNQIARVNEEVYGFSQDQSLFFSYTPQAGATYNSGAVNVYSYPELQVLGQLESDVPGPKVWNFSLDDHYLVVQYASILPAPDTTYPGTDWSDRNVVSTHYYDLTALQPFNPLTPFGTAPVGSFSADSSTYSFMGMYFDPGNSNQEYASTSWQYNFP